MNRTQRQNTARMAIWILSILTVITTLTLIIFTKFPIWGGLIITLVILVPCQIYLNRTKPRK